LAGSYIGADVPNRGGVDLLAVDAPFDGAVGGGDLDAFGVEEFDLAGEEAGAGAVDNLPVGVPAGEEADHDGVDPVVQGHPGRWLPEQWRELG
jgi:hypothetical protein